MFVNFFQKNFFFRNLVNFFSNIRAKRIVELFVNDLDEGLKVLDVGCGTCNISELLISKGFFVKSLDVKNLSFIKNIKPVLYDGFNFPFKNNCFSVSLLIFVLHHTKNPEQIIKESKRVSKEVIIIEDIYKNRFEKFYMFLIDGFLNFEFFNQPRTNKTDSDWKKVFKNNGLNLKKSVYLRSLFGVRQAVYFLEK